MEKMSRRRFVKNAVGKTSGAFILGSYPEVLKSSVPTFRNQDPVPDIAGRKGITIYIKTKTG